jgi:hypothetical protein
MFKYRIPLPQTLGLALVKHRYKRSKGEKERSKERIRNAVCVLDNDPVCRYLSGDIWFGWRGHSVP